MAFDKKEYYRHYYRENKEKYLGYVKKWQEKNKEKMKEYNKEYNQRAEVKEREKIRIRKYRMKNRDKINKRRRERRQERARADPDYWKKRRSSKTDDEKRKDRIRSLSRGYKIFECCELCGSTEKLERHHTLTYLHKSHFITLCKGCHSNFHRYIKTPNVPLKE